MLSYKNRKKGKRVFILNLSILDITIIIAGIAMFYHGKEIVKAFAQIISN